MKDDAFATIQVVALSPYDVWEKLTPGQQAMIDDISQQMDAAMSMPSGASKYAILKMIAASLIEAAP